MITLTIKGNVIPTPGKYRATIGGLKIKEKHIAFRRIYDNSIKKDSVKTKNTGKEKLSIEFKDIPEHLEIHLKPKTLQPDEHGYIVFIYDAAKKNDYGFVQDRLMITVSKENSSVNGMIKVSATIKEDFSSLTEEDLANIPKAVIYPPSIDLGTIERTKSKEFSINIENKGETDLQIRSIKAGYGCSVVKYDDIIKPSETGIIQMIYKAANMKKKFQKRLTIITNDPKKSVNYVKVTAKVK